MNEYIERIDVDEYYSTGALASVGKRITQTNRINMTMTKNSNGIIDLTTTTLPTKNVDVDVAEIEVLVPNSARDQTADA